ncbi:hypothetical protein DY000_02031649 [Brassica cretica]|uniref:Uncharacterized protein n=1 Tax=Brassica cretica TaxID=69181 RepID=A0ABQ7DR81_BRACR|nr:hypothetical protein DY000_02031649 [Brassica cretica]
MIARWIERLLVLIKFHQSCSAKGSLPSAGNTASPPPAKEPKKNANSTLGRVGLLILGFQVPDPRSRIQVRVSGYQPYMEVKSNGSTKKHAPTTLLPLFPATNADIPPKEIKAFYPLQETQDPCLSKSPRLHPSTSCKKRKFPVKE